MRRNLTLIAALSALVNVSLPATASATSYYPIVCLQRPMAAAEGGTCPPRLNFQMTAGLIPRSLPPKTAAPVAIRIQAKAGYDDGTRPPALKEVTMEFDRHGEIDARGLPVCGRLTLEQQVGTVRHVCRDSIVGEGVARVSIGDSENRPLSIPLTLFNGGVNNGVTKLLLHSYIPVPIPMPLISVVRFRSADKGRFGLEAKVKIPPIANGMGSILGFSLTTKRLVDYAGTRYSYARASCPDNRLIARMENAFGDGTTIAGSVTRYCTPKRLSG